MECRGMSGMLDERGENQIKKQAQGDMVVILNQFKHKRRLVKLYRYGMYAALVISCIIFTLVGLYQLDHRIPSTIYVRAGMEQSFHLNIPATGSIMDVANGGESNIPKERITIDLNRPVTMKTGALNKYSMRVFLFGFLPLKNVDIQVVDNYELIPGGEPVGIYLKAKGVLVIGVGDFTDTQGTGHSPAKNLLKTGDYIQKLDGTEIQSKDDLIKRVEASQGRKIKLEILRGDAVLVKEIQPIKDQSGRYKIGVWVRDNAQGIGTMTFVDQNGRFGALGHGISDVDTSVLMDITGGSLYETKIIDVVKGHSGAPGEMTGLIVYSKDKMLGDIYENSARGVYGYLNQKGKRISKSQAMPVGFKHEIKKGPAQIICTIEDEPCMYDVEITAIHLEHDNINRGIELKVTDEELLKKTGGIVQGMSGAPIIQDGKIIGAVTHVLIQDCKKGYGIFIEHMLEH